MKILQINNYAYLKGGSEKVFLDTISLLKSNGHEVRAFSVVDGTEPQIEVDKSVRVIPWNKRIGLLGKLKGGLEFVYNKHTAKCLEELILDFKPDIAHIHIYYGRLSNSIISVLNRYNIPIVQSVHEYRLICPAYTCLNSKMEICDKCALSSLKLSCVKGRCIKNSLMLSGVAAFECFIRDYFFNNVKKFSRFIMVSDFIKREHIKFYPQVKNKSEVLYNFIDLTLYSKFRVEVKGDYVLYLGRLSKEKGIMTLIEAFSRMPDKCLKIAGTGPMKDEIVAKIKELGLHNISLEGYVSGENLYRLIAKARFVVVPSEWYENNPLSIIESFALGTPVIASKIGGIPELVQNGITGYLHTSGNSSELEDCIIEASSLSDEHYKSLVDNCIKFAESKFDSNKHYESLMKIYNNVVN